MQYNENNYASFTSVQQQMKAWISGCSQWLFNLPIPHTLIRYELLRTTMGHNLENIAFQQGATSNTSPLS